ncbi:hypothetical protein S40288_06990 [Stachybotrys chartarum IBT 40288]|nr:hypothetical protein S40288_06990 [Stachybotrys chartarum IBT 40288]
MPEPPERDDKNTQGQPAALHEWYIPSAEQKHASAAQYHGDAAVDVIFVHGLGSKVATTWAYKRKDGSRYHWLTEQFPKDMPDARVLVYEYASRWYDDPVRTDLRECAAQFLRTLLRDRRHAHSKKLCATRRTRPMILIGHSFGGLVIKQAMSMASHVSANAANHHYENHRDILAAIAGVIFLGTPHRGSSFSWLGGVKSFFGRRVLQVESNDELITLLTPLSPVLHFVQSEFEETCADDRLSNLQLVCYYEMRDVFPLRRRVVEQESATLDNAMSRGMNANHMEMNTFYAGDAGQKDNNYDHFISDVQMLFADAQTHVPKRFKRWVYGSPGPDDVRERLQRALNASRDVQDITFLRYLKIHRSARYTCQWIHNVPEFSAWRDGAEKHGTIWINGHGGTGKSVLAAYIIDSLRKGDADLGVVVREEWSACSHSVGEASCSARRSGPTVLHFFCGVDRSYETTRRVLGTLIHQVLLTWRENEELVKIASDLLDSVMTTEALTETLVKMVHLVGHVYLVVDNLEDITHSKEDNADTLLQSIAELQRLADVRVLISSQEIPQISDAIAEHFESATPITVTDYTMQDILQFTEARSEALFTKKPVLEEKKDVIMSSLQSRSQGSFQWIASAFQHLSTVEDAQDVEPELDDIQLNLLDSYDKTFRRLASDRTDRILKRIGICLKFVAASATPVTCADIKTAWLIQELLDSKKAAREDFTALFDKEKSESRAAVAEGDIRNYLGSIIDVCSDSTLQFKHLSYLKALTRTNKSVEDDGSEKIKFTIEEAHRDMSLICMTVCRFSTFVHANSFSDWRTPLVQYAWNFWAYHIQKAKVVFATVVEAAEKKRDLKLHSRTDPEWERRKTLQDAFNAMITDVGYDGLLYVEALMDFISRPLSAVPGRFSDREYVLSLQRAQEALLQPAKNLCTLKKNEYDSLSSRLEHARQATELAVSFLPSSTSVAVVQKKAGDKLQGMRKRLLGETSTIRRLRVDDYLQTNTVIPRPTGSPKLLLDLARELRIVALRFSVDPIYSALLAMAGGTSFSPLHPLVYLAQFFEEGGLYPYWDSLAPGRDLMEPFVCPGDDPEYTSAKFVLHCFEWRDPRLNETLTSPARMSAGFYIRMTPFSLDIRPTPSPGMLGLRRVTTENFEQVKRLHGVKPEQFYTAQNTYNLLQSGDEAIQKFFSRLSHAHMRYSLVVHESDNPAILSQNPQQVLLQHTPDEVREAPIRELIRALPALGRTVFIHYMVFLLEVFGRLARRAMGVHVSRIEGALMELQQVKMVFLRVMDPGPLPRMKLQHLACAALLFIARCMYFPWWGAYIWYHSWAQFGWAWKHPSAYVDAQKDYKFWRMCFQLLIYTLNGMLAQIAIDMTRQPAVGTSRRFDVSMTYALFNAFCAVDRSLFAMCSAAATVLSCGLVMFSGVESIAQMLRFSMLFWLMTFIELVLTAVRIGAAQNGNLVFAAFGVPLIQLGVLYLTCLYVLPITAFLYGLTKPARIVAMWTFRVLLRASFVTAQALAIGLLFVLVFRAFFMLHKFIWDPYDVKSSLRHLLQTSEEIHNTLVVGGVRQYRRVGWYPLGAKQRDGEESHVALANAVNGPPRNMPLLQKNLSEAQKSLNGTAGDLADRMGELLEPHELQQRLDRMVLTAGGQMGDAIDGVGQQVGRVIGGVGQHVGKRLANGATRWKLQGRDAINGRHMKKE